MEAGTGRGNLYLRVRMTRGEGKIWVTTVAEVPRPVFFRLECAGFRKPAFPV